MTNTLHLDILPYEVLLMIFDYCDAFDLVRLSEVCKRFYEIVCSDAVWIKKSRGLLVTNQTSERFRKRCNPILSPRNMWLTSYNWRYGRYDNETLILNKVKMMPWLQMTNDTLWWSGGNQLYGVKRNSKHFKEKVNVEINYNNRFYNNIYRDDIADICKFVLCGNFIISGHSNGDIHYWLDKSHKGYPRAVKLWRQRVHFCDINGIDATSQTIISGSVDGMIKIQKIIDLEKSNLDEKIIIDFMNKIDRVQSLVIDPTGTQFAVGSSGTTNIPPLNLINIETLIRYTMFDKIRYPWKHGAGILDMVWDNPQTLLTCGYDTFVRKWDLRTEKCVSSWADPNDAALYCISSDHQYSIITGAQHGCAAVLWDQRMCNFVQLYYVNSRTVHLISPIYSLRFDSSHLYCALDRRLAKLSFSGQSCQRYNYKQFYSN
ncbi:F-box/WD repeat-containing protein 4-like [Cataglyphis hispanica]|uniref:F-box/WD repeat-containing protein 4-like n=1 Tax=Cataglyphis hispanica TaxID=1086592 RepID=UPI00217FBEDA|nr:F-box/WD repeat-containing protein 4-like [Cataglyphis hispanica]